jgi:flagellar protein FlgJ
MQRLPQLQQQLNNVHDLSGLDSLRQASHNAETKDEALMQAAQQFESIFMHMLIKSMRKAEDVLASDSPFNSNYTKFYRDMYDQQIASDMSSKGALGLADLIYKQLGGGDKNYLPASLMKENKLSDWLASKGVSENNNNSIEDTADVASVSATEAVSDDQASNQRQSWFDTPKEFLESLWPYAKQAAKAIGVAPYGLLAQAALETGWGKKVLASEQGGSSHNLFNIKADQRWSGDKVSVNSLEFEQGLPVQRRSDFRSYNSFADSFNDYANFVKQSGRYKDAVANASDTEAYFTELHKAGYATDPDYVQKIKNVITGEDMSQFIQQIGDSTGE